MVRYFLQLSPSVLANTRAKDLKLRTLDLPIEQQKRPLFE